MTTKQITNIQEKYFQLLQRQNSSANKLDYSIVETHKPNLQQLADLGNSVISVFDVFQKKHVFNSSNWGTILGYTYQDIENEDDYFLDSKIHPDDFLLLLQNALSIIKLFFKFSTNEKLEHKLVSEYRILNAENNYVRVIEQHQVLELDTKGNLWLSLSILDISPNQKNMDDGLKYLPKRNGVMISIVLEYIDNGLVEAIHRAIVFGL
ncbi:MAG: hypothetical protein R2798_06010 [Chitinophagales bacterium]